MALAITPAMAPDALASAIKAQLVPLLCGSPGVGKSSIIHALAKAYNLFVIDLRLAQCDPTDLLGFPSVTNGNGRSGYLPMDTFPLAGDKVPDGYSGWLLLLDEFTSADREVQKAAYKLVLDRMVGTHHLHSKVAIICAGNLATDNAIVEEMSTALQSRLIHLEMKTSSEDFIRWAETNNINTKITAFLKFKPDLIYNFRPDHDDKTFACPRTWEFASRLLDQIDSSSPLALPLLAGAISEGVAREFLAYLKVYKDLISIDEIRRSPSTAPVPSDPGTLFALTGLIAESVSEANIEDLIIYIRRLPVEFQIVCLRETVRRNPGIDNHDSVNDWIADNGADLY